MVLPPNTPLPSNGATAAPYSLPTGKPFERFGGPARSTQYQLIKAGEIDSFLVGARRYIVVQSWIDYVARQRAQEAARLASGQRAKMRGVAPEPSPRGATRKHTNTAA